MIYLEIFCAIYGMLKASLLWYTKFRGNLEKIGFNFIECDPCVANMLVNKQQHNIRFHLNEVRSSHMDSEINTKFSACVN